MSIGVAVGVGIFRSPGEVAALLDAPLLILAAWLLGGLYALLDAQVLAELSAMIPRAGGWYAYIHRAYGAFPAFLYGWATSLVTYPGSVAALAIPIAEYLARAFPVASSVARGAAVACLIVLASTNALGLRAGRGVQNGLTAAKLLGLAALAFGLFLIGDASADVGPASETARRAPSLLPLVAAMGLALQTVLWSYDGYGDVVTLGEEIREPGRNVPRAIAVAVVSITALYLVLNAAFLRAIGVEGLARSTLPAADAARVVFGGLGEAFIVGLALLTILDSMNAQLLSGPRITFAMARDGLFFGFARSVTEGGTPIGALALQTAAALAFVLLIPDFRQLVALTIFVIWLASAMNTVALFVLRRREPDRPRPFRVLGYPWAPAVLLLGSGALLANMVVQQPGVIVKGLVVIGAGVPIYGIWRLVMRLRAESDGSPTPS